MDNVRQMVNDKRRIVLVVHNVRSAHNVGSILRSADGFSVEKVYLSGYTPYPLATNDQRLPHIARRITERIAKTALGADKSLSWQHQADALKALKKLRSRGYLVAALEQTTQAVELADFRSEQPVVLVVGNEIGGLDKQLLKTADVHLTIPMLGRKESYNVSVAAAIALYHLRWYNQTPDDR